ncbi:MAG: hypothetical protein ABGY11_12235 [Candidatus Thioglobus sp.]
MPILVVISIVVPLPGTAVVVVAEPIPLARVIPLPIPTLVRNAVIID